MRLGVAFVNHRSEALLVPRVAELVAAGIEVVVVDNSGTYPQGPERVDPGLNLGFGAGCNLAVTSLPASVEAVCFHNPDVTVPVAELQRLANALSEQGRPGVLAPAEADGDVLRVKGYRYPSIGREAILALSADRRRRRAPAPSVIRSRASTMGRRFGGGALLVVDRGAHDAIGGFDERFFLFAEDLDYWDRMASVRDVGFDEKTVAWHRTGTSSPLGWAPRELLRWLGVELFLEVRGRAWQPYRAAHRLARRRLPTTSLGTAVGDAWAEGQTPATVVAHLRPRLASGELLDMGGRP